MTKFAIIIAAGASTRMGTCKTSLPWCGETLLIYQLNAWLNLGFTPLIVLGLHNADKQKDCPPSSIVIINPHSHVGKTTSIKAGLQHIPQYFEVLAISAVVQRTKSAAYQQLLQAHKKNSALITAPMYKGKMGHPLLFSNEMRSTERLAFCYQTLRVALHFHERECVWDKRSGTAIALRKYLRTNFWFTPSYQRFLLRN